MTTRHLESVTCAICDHKQIMSLIGSTNSFGYTDLDMRPPEMQRSTIDTWVQRCDSCGYCANSLDVENPMARSVIESQLYQNTLSNPNYPQLANEFKCKAIIDQANGKYADAAWSSLFAAWACDDEGHSAQAIQCRKEAIQILERAQQENQLMMEREIDQTLLLVDLLRRSGQLKQAEQLIASARKGPLGEDYLLQILDYQQTLIKAGDTASHTIGEAIEKNEEL